MHCRCCARSECQRCCRWSGTCVAHRGRRQQGRLRVALLASPRRRAHKQPSSACHSSRDRRFKRRDAVAAGGGVWGALPLAAAARAAAASFRACVRVLSLPCRAIVSTLKEGARAGPGPAPRKAQHGASRRRNAPPAQPAPRRQNQYASLHAEPSSASATLQWSSCLRICPSESKCSSMNTLRAQAFRSGGGTRGRAHAARPVAEGRRLGQPATPNAPPLPPSRKQPPGQQVLPGISKQRQQPRPARESRPPCSPKADRAPCLAAEREQRQARDQLEPHSLRRRGTRRVCCGEAEGRATRVSILRLGLPDHRCGAAARAGLCGKPRRLRRPSRQRRRCCGARHGWLRVLANRNERNTRGR